MYVYIYIYIVTQRSPDGFRTNFVFRFKQKCHKYNTCLQGVASSVRILPQIPHILPHVATKVDYGKLWHSCDDPFCPDPCLEVLKP